MDPMIPAAKEKIPNCRACSINIKILSCFFRQIFAPCIAGIVSGKEWWGFPVTRSWEGSKNPMNTLRITAVNNVLISGGDSLALPTHVLGHFLAELTRLEHLDYIRFGSRMAVTFPD